MPLVLSPYKLRFGTLVPVEKTGGLYVEFVSDSLEFTHRFDKNQKIEFHSL